LANRLTAAPKPLPQMSLSFTTMQAISAADAINRTSNTLAKPRYGNLSVLLSAALMRLRDTTS
jgi:hypothetical protein